MRKSLKLGVLAGVAAVCLAVPIVASGATAITGHMVGSNIVNAAGGDPDGSANVTLRVNRVKQRVCFTVTYKKLERKVRGAFIHKGSAGEVGRPVITLFEGTIHSPVSGCVHDLKKKIVKRLKRKPSQHYVDITTENYPNGAIRGQLTR